MADTEVEAAPGDENDDNWLYGDSIAEQTGDKPSATNEKEQKQTDDTTDGAAEGEGKEQEDGEANNDDSHFNDEHFAEVAREGEDQNGDADSQNNGDSDSDDSDDIKVTIGEIKSGPQAYASLNIKRGVGLVAGAAEKPRTITATGGKVTLEDFEGPGSINGVPALEFNIDTIEDKPWNKPGADISDYFNYGFNEVTWSAYCERQRRMRVSEAGVGLHAPPPRPPVPDMRRPPGPGRHDDGMPPIMSNNYQVRENTIQVMTAERREYGRGGHPRDMLGAPPDYFGPPPTDHYFQPPPHVAYEEPWGHPEQTGWAPTDIKELTPGPGPMGPGPMGPMGPAAPPGVLPPAAAAAPGLPPPHLPPHLMPAPPFAAPYRPHPPHTPHAPHERDRDRDRERDRDRDRDRMREREERERRERDRREDDDRERDRDRERSRSIKPDRIREKSYRRERSRSRSRRHKSRSRSPRPRERSSERSRDHERSRERERSRDRERSVKPKTKDKDKEEEK